MEPDAPSIAIKCDSYFIR